MEQYIPKSALVAWAKETYLCENASMIRKVCYKQLLEHLDTLEVKEICVDLGDPKGDKSAEHIIDTKTLEVKEVDFGTEVYKYIDEHFNVYDDGNQTLQTKDKKSLIGRYDVENIAKHFYLLGLAQKGEEV